MNILETESSNTNSFPKTWAFQTQTWQHCSTVFVLEFIKCSIPKLDVHYVDLSMTKTIPQITVFMGGTKKKTSRNRRFMALGFPHYPQNIPKYHLILNHGRFSTIIWIIPTCPTLPSGKHIKKPLKIVIEIVDLPMKHGDFPSFFVCLPVPRMAYRQGVQEGRLAIESQSSVIKIRS
jgi:hypothetical protein